MKLRKHGRIAVEFSASLSALTFRGTGIVLDISVAGCRIESQLAVKKDYHLGLLIQVPGYDIPLHIQASIRWTNNEEFGMEFLQMELNDRQRLYELVEKMSGYT